MAGEIIVPGQFDGKYGGEARLETLVVDEVMLYDNDDGGPPVVEALTELLGEEGEDWVKVPHVKPSNTKEVWAKMLKIPMFEIEALTKGVEHVRLQRLALR